MTAQEWTVCADWRDLLYALPEHRASERRLRLWIVGAIEQRTNAETDPRTLQAIRHIFTACDESLPWQKLRDAEWLARSVARETRYGDPIDYAIELMAVKEYVPELWYRTVAEAATLMERIHSQLTDLFRCVFANPFQANPFSPLWRTTPAVALARTMYDALLFDRMPILADALEEAGCEVPAVLDHCRDPAGVHVRGCWVVDGVLGKT